MRQTAERRVVQIAAKFYLRSKEGLVVVSNDIRESVMVWSVGLDDDPAGLLTPSGPSCYLAQELKSSLHGPEVGKVQGEIGENRSYQRHSRYVVPIGESIAPGNPVCSWCPDPSGQSARRVSARAAPVLPARCQSLFPRGSDYRTPGRDRGPVSERRSDDRKRSVVSGGKSWQHCNERSAAQSRTAGTGESLRSLAD